MNSATKLYLLKMIPAWMLAACLIVPLTADDAWARRPGGGWGGNASQGKVIYDGICYACHGVDGGGRFARRSIRGKSARSIMNAIEHKVYDMAFLYYLTNTDYKNLEAYLKTVSGAGVQRLYGSGNAARGEPLFRRSCTGCHSINNGTSPGIGPDLMSVPNAPTWVQAFIAEPKAMATHS